MTKRKTKIAIIAGCIFFGAAVVIWRVQIPYQNWDSRDTSLHIVVTKQWLASLLPVSPGQGGDAPGWVSVIDKKTNKILLRKKVQMVNGADEAIGKYRDR
jgi:hypothetical protein